MLRNIIAHLHGAQINKYITALICWVIHRDRVVDISWWSLKKKIKWNIQVTSDGFIKGSMNHVKMEKLLYAPNKHNNHEQATYSSSAQYHIPQFYLVAWHKRHFEMAWQICKHPSSTLIGNTTDSFELLM